MVRSVLELCLLWATARVFLRTSESFLMGFLVKCFRVCVRLAWKFMPKGSLESVSRSIGQIVKS
jgi:hypothetical protein